MKHSYIVRNADDIPSVMAEAFEIAERGRPGPVLIDIPKDIQVAESRATLIPRAERPAQTELNEDGLRRAEGAVAMSRKPLFYIGGGVVRAGAEEEVRQLVERSGIPAVCTLQGLGVLPTGHPQLLGMMGMHGSRPANLAVQEADLLIVVGARFDDRATGVISTFAPNARVVHFDRDASEISKLRHADVAVPCKIKPTLAAFRPEAIDIGDWLDQCEAWKAEHVRRYDAPGETIYAPALLKELSEKAGDGFVGVSDVGQHQMWVAQHCRFSRPQAHITSGGLGSMGFGLPTAMGAKVAEPDSVVVNISGDGGVMMNIQELATLRRYNIPLKVVILNNSRLGMVRQWQELFFDENYSETDLSDNPDFAEVAKAFGVEGFTIDRRDQVSEGIDRLLAAEGPIVMHAVINPSDNVWPLVPQGKSNADMLDGADGY